ncbi:MAG: hypothetical protein A2539_10295 [Elusimicrobia bacterium RIFOXYD2_FULL_34_15]|nr:MAG: hypothetical protein A2539_10295 [Elusimicrobia bacterium RIFOXYD2_FULL_34_15]
MSEQEMDLRDYLIVVKKKKKMIVKIMVIGFLISVAIAFIQPTVYQTTAIIEQAKIERTTVESAENLETLFKQTLNPFLKILVEKMAIPEDKAFSLTQSFSITEIREPNAMKISSGYLLIMGMGKTPEKAKELVDNICSMILKRENDMVQEALSIVNKDLDDLREQILNIKKDVGEIDQKIAAKEKTNILAQSYVFQTMVEAKENALKRQFDLQNRLASKEMEIKYYTKSAIIASSASLPKMRMAQNKLKFVLIITIVSYLVAIFLAFIVDYFEKNPL